MATSKPAWLTPHWIQRGFDVLRATLDHSQRDKVEAVEFLFACGMWDRTKQTHDAAISRYNSNLNPEKAMQFKLSEIWALMKHLRRFDLLHAMAEDCGFRLVAIPTEERKQELLERFTTAMEANNAIAQQALAELQGIDTPQQIVPAVAAAVREGGAFFDVPEDARGF
jgi:hypothetical protein